MLALAKASPTAFTPQTRANADVPAMGRSMSDRFAGWLAEREGFEPSIRFWRILTFQASAFDHSATAPHALESAALNAWKRFRKAGKAGMLAL